MSDTGNVCFWYESIDPNEPDLVTTWTPKGVRVSDYWLTPLINHVDGTAEVEIAWASLCPPALLVAGCLYYATSPHSRSTAWRHYFEGMLQLNDSDLRLIVLLSLLDGIVWAASAWPIARRRTITKQSAAAWPLFAFWFGIPAVVTMLALVPNPAQVACPGCGRRRVVTRETCEHCGAPFAGPTRDGTEIFDDQSPLTAAGAVSDTAAVPA